MSRWVKVPEEAKLIPVREGRKLKIKGEEIALFNLGDKYLATYNVCPHKQGPLSDGIVSGESVFCPLHNWKVNLKSGRVEKPVDQNCSIKTYRLKEKDGALYVEVNQ